MANVSIIRGAEAGIVDRISATITALRDSYQRYKMYRQTLNELSALSDRDLHDLGLHRSSIGAVAQEAAYGK